MKYAFLIFLLSTLTTNSTTYAPIPLDQQLIDGDGVIWGKFLDQTYKKLPSDEIVTVGSFKVLKHSGLSYKHFLNRNKVDVFYPGGVWQGVVYKIHGIPEFKKNDEVVLILKNTPFGFSIHNLGLGKYNVLSLENETYLQSSVFTEHPSLGKITFQEFNQQLQDRFQEQFSDIPNFKTGVVAPKASSKDRKLASVPQNKESKLLLKDISIFWIVFVLTLLGLISRRRALKWEDS